MSDTRTIRVLLYKAKWGDKSIIDNLISIWTQSKYSHIEIWTPDDTGLFFRTVSQVLSPSDAGCVGTCWTSTMRGEWDGTVKRDASKVLKNPDRWDYTELDIKVENYDYDCMMGYMECEVEENKGYAIRDIWKFIIGSLHRPDNSRNICSEFVANALYMAGILEEGGIVSPKKVHQKLTALGYETKSL